MIQVGIRAVGAHVPPLTVSNDDVAAWPGVKVDAKHIGERTGIATRRFAARAVPTSWLAYNAVEDLLRRYPDALDGIGGIILSTSTPDQPSPHTAAVLAGMLDLRVGAWDLNMVCTGGLAALVHGAVYAQATGKPMLVVAADKYSGIMQAADWRSSAILADGAGAVVVGAVPEDYGLLAHGFTTDGSLEAREMVGVRGGGTAVPLTPEGLQLGLDRVGMDGRAVRDWAFANIPPLVDQVLAEAGATVGDLDRVIPHQANPRLLAKLAAEMGIDDGRVTYTANRYGNAGSASILIALQESFDLRPPASGELIGMFALGGGMSGGMALWRCP